jgi:hypothetical protein
MAGSPQQLISDLAARNSAAHALAVVVSIASRIEPELLRSARLGMLSASADASAEADLWLSPLMKSRGAQFAVMRADVAGILRDRLRENPDRLKKAAKILCAMHRESPPALKVEEEITWRTLVDANDPEIKRLFGQVSLALAHDRIGLARWATRALPEMPLAASTSDAGWGVHVKAAALLGQTLAEPSRAVTGAPAPLPADLPKVEIGLRLFGDSLRLSHPPEPDAKTIAVPSTTPLLLMVEWQQQDRTERRVASFLPRSSQLVRPIGTAGLRVTTAASDCYLLQPAGERKPQSLMVVTAKKDGFAVRAYRGDRAILLAFDAAAASRRGLMGFAVARTGSSGTAEWLRNFVSFGGATPSPLPSNEAPFQRFRWIDSSSGLGEGPAAYRICAMQGEPGALRVATELRIDMGLPPPPGDIEVGFTSANPSARFDAAEEPGSLRPSGPEGQDARMFDTAPYQESYRRLGATAHELMSNFIAECVDDPNSEVHVFAFDIDHPDIVHQFARLGKRLKIVLDDSRVHEKPMQPIEALLSQAGCEVIRFHFKRYSHSKCIIRIVGGKPAAVLTGSTNFSIQSLYAQSNYVIVVRQADVAQAYEGFFQYALGHPRARMLRAVSDPPLISPPGIRVLFTPSESPANLLLAMIRQARSSILFYLGGEVAPAVVDALQKQRAKGVFVAGVLQGNDVRIFWDGVETLRRQGRSLPGTHGKFIVTDFSGSSPSILAGSSSFAAGSLESNGDNVIFFRDRAIAIQFAVHALQMIDNYRFRASVAAARRPETTALAPTDAWVDGWFEPQTMQSQERRLLIDGAGFADDEKPDAAPASSSAKGKGKQPARKKGAVSSSGGKTSSSSKPPKKKQAAAKSSKKKTAKKKK